MNKNVETIKCDDYVNCVGCSFRKLVDMDMYDENGDSIGKETILFCERNGKISDVFKEGNLEDLLKD